MGYFEFDLQGGELLLQPKKLFQVLEAIRPERFYLYLTTNGYHLDDKIAKKLAEHKVSRVSVSIDSMEEKIHDEYQFIDLESKTLFDDLQLTLQSLNYTKNEIKSILPIIIKETDGLKNKEKNISFENLLKLAMNYLDKNSSNIVR